jgi:hypothetical protein
MNKRDLSVVALPMLAVLAGLPSVVGRAQREAPPTPEQVQALVMRVIENQHRDDHALEQYERKERVVSRRGTTSDERTAEVVSAGDRIVRVELERDGQAAGADVTKTNDPQSERSG